MTASMTPPEPWHECHKCGAPFHEEAETYECGWEAGS